ncbi:EthD family reductase [Sphingomonas sp. RP10(2022)]|uniref:EthD family reductase n=1 Tax=Sphingomonas liriopis TaxID=2949094 RepID=A0A9X2KPU8_9SPHN|nr:EthD family reductase [Sphingomonas liriopis]MCP3734275.1 EthD family reductase [Sphingomonas liriopis]
MQPILTLFYPATTRDFDVTYYAGQHLPLVDRIWGSFLDRVEVLKGVTSLVPGAALPFAALTVLYFKSDADLQEALAHPDAVLLQQDIARFSDVSPIGQVNVAVTA